MCLAEFAATFVANYKPNDEGDMLPPESETTSSRITLTDGFGKMSHRKREAVIKVPPVQQRCRANKLVSG